MRLQNVNVYAWTGLKILAVCLLPFTACKTATTVEVQLFAFKTQSNMAG